MIDTVGPKLLIFNRWIDTIVASMTDISIDTVGIDPLIIYV